MIFALQGGMANQMWIYAVGRSVAEAKQEELFFTRDLVDADPKRCYSLDVFNVDIQFVPELKEPIYRERNFCFDPQIYEQPPGTSFIGHFQTERALNVPLVRRIFNPPHSYNPASMLAAKEIVSYGENSVAVHYRRTDYLAGPNPAFHGNLGPDYYAAAMSRIEAKYPNAHYFVFSDDPGWCQENLQGDKYTIVSHNKAGDANGPGTEHEDLWLMALCQHAIIANSSFSWWGAFLGDVKQNRVVIAPKIWFRDPGMSYHDVVPLRWEKL